MARYHKILWSEGLFLTQHHFQQADSWHEQDRAFAHGTLTPFAWGGAHITIDPEAVANRLFTLTEFEGILPDGTTVRAPSVDDPPSSRSFAELFAPTAKVLSVYLGLPRMRPGAAGVKLENQDAHGPTRYAQAFTTLPDDVTGEHEREISYLKKRLCLLFSGEDLEGYDTLKIAEIERSQEGVPQLRTGYVPPLLAIGGSDWLLNQLRGILETASAKSQTLADQVRQRTPTLTEFSTSDMPNFLKLHTINAYIPRLGFHFQNPVTHPVALYELLAQFAGHLCAFQVGMHPRDLAGYRHDELGATFGTLIPQLRSLLEAVVEAHFIRIPLNRIDVSRMEGTVDNAQLFTNSDFYLGVRAEMSESQIAAEFPKHAKIVSPDKIDRLIGGNLPGVNLIFVQLPPAAIPRRAGWVYFRIDPRGDRWDYIKKASQIAIYAPPAEFPGWDAECLAVERA
jgi:type VI secretion system protein ImpJ